MKFRLRSSYGGAVSFRKTPVYESPFKCIGNWTWCGLNLQMYILVYILHPWNIIGLPAVNEDIHRVMQDNNAIRLRVCEQCLHLWYNRLPSLEYTFAAVGYFVSYRSLLIVHIGSMLLYRRAEGITSRGDNVFLANGIICAVSVRLGELSILFVAEVDLMMSSSLWEDDGGTLDVFTKRQ